MHYNHCIIVQTFRKESMIAEKVYPAETSIRWIKERIKKAKTDGLKFKVICRSDFIIEELEG